MRTTAITDAKLRRIIKEELIRHYLIQEGLWDDVKDGVVKLSKKVTDAFGDLAKEWVSTVKEKLAELQKVPDGVLTVVDAVKSAMQATGQPLPLDENLKAAKELATTNALEIAQSDLSGPVHDAAKGEQTAGGSKAPASPENLKEIYAILSNKSYIRNTKQLNEADAVTLIGIGLAAVGGIPMLCKGLATLATKLGAENSAKILTKAYKISHKIEEKVIDYLVPDIFSYEVHKFLFKKGFHVAKEKKLLTFEQYKAGELDARKKTDDLIYKAMLIYFAFKGIAGALKAGASLLGFIEGAATGVKGIEIAAAGAEVATIVRTGVKAKTGV